MEDPRFDDDAAERRFQRLRVCGRHDELLEFASLAELEARCGELYERLGECVGDRRLLMLYDGYAAAWELCRGLVGAEEIGRDDNN